MTALASAKMPKSGKASQLKIVSTFAPRPLTALIDLPLLLTVQGSAS